MKFGREFGFTDDQPLKVLMMQDWLISGEGRGWRKGDQIREVQESK